MAKVLVAYWTKTGTTEEYAVLLGQILASRGHTVEVRTLAQAGSLDSCDAIVLGGPINGMRPVPGLTAFLAAHARELAGKPGALFTVSYMHGKAGKGWNSAIEKGSATAASAMGARATAILPGRIQGKLPLLMRLVFGIPKDTPLDRFDAETMKAWAEKVANMFA